MKKQRSPLLLYLIPAKITTKIVLRNWKHQTVQSTGKLFKHQTGKVQAMLLNFSNLRKNLKTGKKVLLIYQLP